MSSMQSVEESTEYLLREQWAEPLSLDVELSPVFPFDIKLMPEPFRDWVENASYRMDRCAPDFMAIGVMVCIGSLIGNRAIIKPKAFDDWHVVPNIWGAAIGRPSTKKSPTLKESCSFMQSFDDQSRLQYEAELNDYDDEVEYRKLEADNAKAQAKQAIKNGENGRQILKDSAMDEPKLPVRCRRVTNDSTIEKLGELLADNNGMLVYRDELTGWLQGLDREDRSQDRAFYVEAWNGTGGFTSDRIGRGTIDVPNLMLSILGGIQPGKLKPYLLARQRGHGDDGLLERFQLAVYPDMNAAELIDEQPDENARNRALATFERIDALSSDHCLRLSDDAQPLFNEWYEDNLSKCQSCIDVHMESTLAKYPSLIASLALIIHVCEEGVESPISASALSRAAAWCEYLESHARRINGLINNPAIAAQTLHSHLKDLPNPFTSREVRNKTWAGLNSATIENAVTYLCETHHLKEVVEKNPKGGRPSTRYYINPGVL
jgi:hypothetical protein